VKLSDFGISKELDSSTAMSHTAVGSYRYMSPERLLGEKYDASGDIWSVGITIVQMWTKTYPFSSVADTPIDLFGELEHFNFDRTVNKTVFPSMMRKFIQSTLAMNPDQRYVKLMFSRGMFKHMSRADCSELACSQWFDDCGVNSLVDAHDVSFSD
jgi:serine/threonine protein kinase